MRPGASFGEAKIVADRERALVPLAEPAPLVEANTDEEALAAGIMTEQIAAQPHVQKIKIKKGWRLYPFNLF